MKNLIRAARLVTLFGGAMAVYGQQEKETWREANLKAVEVWTRDQTARCAGRTNVWISRGVVADGASRTVEVFGEAIGLSKDTIAEFLLIGENSDKGHEALAYSFAQAGDIARALEFIGLPRGRPFNTTSNWFWARGERVRVTIQRRDVDAAPVYPLSQCVYDGRTKKPLTDLLVYVGSTCQSVDGRMVCRADEPSPGSIISSYNEYTTVIDMPGFSPQSAVYGDLVVDERRVFPKGAPVRLMFMPVFRADGRPRVVGVSLDVRVRENGGAGLGSLSCVSRSLDGALPSATNDFAATLARFAALAQDGRDPFVSLTLTDDITVAAARDLARVLKAVEGEGGIRVEPPPAGQLFFRAFLPNEKWRSRAERTTQPCELHLARRADGGWSQKFVRLDEDWSNPDRLDPELTVHEKMLQSPDDLAAQIALLSKDVWALFVFTPGDAPLASFMPAVRQIQKRLPNVYLFCD